ncbi:DUF4097 family beta strand repeat-containing protein [Streptomyces sp. NPDC049954]|uniref:DUF4097 family beta strand repeat-containing protein n=1 Tax=Streptomyces sp. NPDC049954 TaxID=3155779 RepID=UPI0034138D9F
MSPGRHGSRRAVRIALSSAFAVLVAGLLSGCGGGDEVHARKDFAYDGTRLTLRTSNVKLRIVPYDGATVRVDRWLRGSGLRSPKATWSLDEDRLKVELDCPGINFSCEGRAEVRVPRKLAVDVDSRNASVRAAGLRHPVTITSRNGGVTLSDVRGALNVTTTSASVSVDRVTGPVRLSAENGGITAHHVDGSLHARATNGRMDIEEVTGDSDLQSSNSGIDATSLHGDANARTTNGKVRLGFAEPPARVVGRTVNGQVSVVLPDDGTVYRTGGATTNGHRTLDVPHAKSATEPHLLDLSSRNGDVRAEVRKAS